MLRAVVEPLAEPDADDGRPRPSRACRRFHLRHPTQRAVDGHRRADGEDAVAKRHRARLFVPSRVGRDRAGGTGGPDAAQEVVVVAVHRLRGRLVDVGVHTGVHVHLHLWLHHLHLGLDLDPGCTTSTCGCTSTC